MHIAALRGVCCCTALVVFEGCTPENLLKRVAQL
jgi:hypothetical protein